MKQIYWGEKDQAGLAESISSSMKEGKLKKGEEAKLNWGTMKKIFFWWGITIPFAIGVSMGTCKAFTSWFPPGPDSEDPAMVVGEDVIEEIVMAMD